MSECAICGKHLAGKRICDYCKAHIKACPRHFLPRLDCPFCIGNTREAIRKSPLEAVS